MAMYDCFPYSLIEDSGKDVTTQCRDIQIKKDTSLILLRIYLSNEMNESDENCESCEKNANCANNVHSLESARSQAAPKSEIVLVPRLIPRCYS